MFDILAEKRLMGSGRHSEDINLVWNCLDPFIGAVIAMQIEENHNSNVFLNMSISMRMSTNAVRSIL